MDGAIYFDEMTDRRIQALQESIDRLNENLEASHKLARDSLDFQKKALEVVKLGVG